VTRAALILLCCAAPLLGCEQKEQCRPARVTARTALLRYRVAVRAELEGDLSGLEQKLRQARARQAKIDALQACAKLAAADSPKIPPPCLTQAGLTRAPTYQEVLAEQRGLAALQRTQKRLLRETKRIDGIDALIKRLDCPAGAVKRAVRGVPDDPGPRVRLLREAGAAAERLIACIEGREIAAGPNCDSETR
jgi:hypothetical protein